MQCVRFIQFSHFNSFLLSNQGLPGGGFRSRRGTGTTRATSIGPKFIQQIARETQGQVRLIHLSLASIYNSITSIH